MTYKIKYYFIFFCFFSLSLFAQNNSTATTQNISPKEIYIGDTAEILYNFYSPKEFPMGDEDFILLKLPKNLENEESYSITKATLSRIENQYSLSILIIPWEVGIIKLPAFDLISVIDENSSGFVIDVSPFAVKSILEKTNENTLQPSSPPILLPGTTYIICGISVFFLLILILLIKALLNYKGLLSLILRISVVLGYKYNALITLYSIRKLNKKNKLFDDKTFGMELEHILRKYLSYRFDEKFYSITSNCIESFFEELTAGELPEYFNAQIENLGAIFRRVDYIRFAQESIDSMRLPQSQYSANFTSEERLQIIKQSQKIVLLFEKDIRTER